MHQRTDRSWVPRSVSDEVEGVWKVRSRHMHRSGRAGSRGWSGFWDCSGVLCCWPCGVTAQVAEHRVHVMAGCITADGGAWDAF